MPTAGCRLDYIDLKLTTQKTTQKTTRKQREILDYLIEHPKASRKDLAGVIDDMTEDGVKYNLNVLQEKKLLKRIGADKGGHWEVINEDQE